MPDLEDTGAFEPKDADAPVGDRVLPSLPERIGRYRVQKILGKGGFGIVYCGWDDQLQRPVAIKVPHPHLAISGRIDSYLAEARAVAKLDHPSILPVWDSGSTEDFPLFVVSKLIEGSDLAKRLNLSRLSFHAAAELIAAIADGLHHAHKHGLVHRDVKPGNILLDKDGRAYLADFGLALREEDLGLGPRRAGTPVYMSPEQARGEGHRVDGRSDIFSLGVVFYQLLTGTRPFKNREENELLRQITRAEARPPRQIEDRIPKELERICLKAINKRAADRYTTAKDMAEDLRSFLQHVPASEGPVLRATPPANDDSGPAPHTPASTGAASQALRIVPKGLRSFEAQDADFFLELLAGPRDRDGLPNSIRFWKSRIEETDPDSSFRVGLVYGPSGCGKSSLFKAGLLPRLSSDVVAAYVEATALETETRLLNGLRKRCPALPAHLGLRETLAALRKGHGLPFGSKVVIILDQFEQWLHAHRQEGDLELVQALRQCDGERVQCIAMVRDEFWLAISRFMRDLEIDLVPGHNIALVDLFDLDHARRVLAQFGRAFGKLPDDHRDVTKEQKEFLHQAVAGLAIGNTVICVRLALFAEMMKGRPWIPATLKEVGGAEGIGATFLEDTFSAATANPKHRLHQKAARAVLKSLLPETGSDIKGNMRSRDELLVASGYASRPGDFDELLRILDGESRLLSPTDPDGNDSESPVGKGTEHRYYQLSHDFLVPSLRDWLTRKDTETRAGRARVRLQERAALWAHTLERRYLPSPTEWIRIRLFTRSRTWTGPQRRMMRSADLHYLGWCIGLLAAAIAVVWAAGDYLARADARALRHRLLSAEMAEIPALLREIEPRRKRVDPLLRESLESETDSKRKTRLKLGLVGADRDQLTDLCNHMLEATPEEFAVIRQVLEKFKGELADRLWEEFANPNNSSERRFRASCALVEYAPSDRRWKDAADFVVDGLLAENPLLLNHWKAALQPVKQKLLPRLAVSLETRPPQDRRAIVEFYRDFAEGDPSAYAALEEQLSIDRSNLGETEKAKRLAAIAAALASLDRGDTVWRFLNEPSTLRSFFIERLSSAGVAPKILKEQLESKKSNVSTRRSLVLAVGGLPPNRASELFNTLKRLYQEDPDPGVHGAIGWVFRRLGREADLREIDTRLATGQREGGRDWYINTHGQTFSLVDPERFGPVEGGLGRPDHRFAVAATKVTLEQFRSFQSQHPLDVKKEQDGDRMWVQVTDRTLESLRREGIPEAVLTKLNALKNINLTRNELERGTARVLTSGEKKEFFALILHHSFLPECPVTFVSWYDAAAYCNWLSAQDGLGPDQWCYISKKELGGLDLASDYLRRTGYRLMTEQEWEFACRAGARTTCSFGAPDRELAGSYAWTYQNSDQRCQPVGLLKPNDLGLFDMHGDAAEWCQEPIKPANHVWDNDVNAVARGSSFISMVETLDCQNWWSFPRKLEDKGISFRIARTIQK